MNRRRIIGLGVVAAAFTWFQVAGGFEARRIDQQRESRTAGQARQVGLRIDSERLMAAVTALADPKFEGRAAGSPGGIAARAWVVDRFKSAGLHPVSGAYVHPFTFKRTSLTGTQEGEGANVLGMCVGSDPALPFFIVSAHYDHLGIRDGQIYPGADDDASGVAVLLEIAAFCQKTPFRRSVVFAAFDAEERGLQGARAFMLEPMVPRDRMALNVNLDMVSRSDKREIFVAGTYHYPDLKRPLEEIASKAPITVLFGHDKPVTVAGGVEDWTNQSDHGPFHAAKIPFVYFGVEDHADYHKPSDTADKINRGFFVDVAETILDAVIALDRARCGMEQQLFDAIKAGQVDAIKQLVAGNPALMQSRDASGASPILAAAYNMKPDVVNALLELGAPVDIFEASVLGKVDRIQEILKGNPSRVSEHAPDGFTPVALAAFFGQPAAVKALIAAGADVKAAAKNALKVQALHAAVAGRNLDIVKAVLAAGADPNAQQQAGFRPMHEAGSNANRALAELLLAHGADPSLTNDDGKSAIDLAREKGHAEFADWLATQRPA